MTSKVGKVAAIFFLIFTLALNLLALGVLQQGSTLVVFLRGGIILAALVETGLLIRFSIKWFF